MYEIDKLRFGAFISELRKEKGITQKELANRLYISDKAVSKWETGHSVPDITLLTPLAELLGVTVTELLECRRIETADKLDVTQANDLVKKVIAFSSEENYGRPKLCKKNVLTYTGCAMVAGLEMLVFLLMLGEGNFAGFPGIMIVGMAMFFGIYFWFFVKEKLPAYYDENKINVYIDGALHMNLPGVYFNNYNWPHIVKAFRMWSVLNMTIVPIIVVGIGMLLPEAGLTFYLPGTLIPILGGLFIPPYIVAKKYQQEEISRQENKKVTVWKKVLWISGMVAFLWVMTAGGLGTTRSGVRMGFWESASRTGWTAEYSYMDGYMQRNLRTADNADGITIVIDTEEGSIVVEIKDEAKNVIFSQENMESGTYEVEASGKYIVRVTAEEHKGGFYIGE